MKILIASISLYLFFATQVLAFSPTIFASGVSAVADAACSNTGGEYTQSFEGAGYAANGDWGNEAETVNGTGTVVDEDYTGIVKCGSQSLRTHVEAAYGAGRVTVTPDATVDTEYFATYYYIDNEALADGGFDNLVTHLNASGRGWRVRLLQTAGQLQLRFEFYDVGVFDWDTSQTVTNVSLDTQYRVEVYYDGDGVSEGWEFRVDGVTIDSGSNNLDGSLNDLVYGTYVGAAGGTSTYIFDNTDVDLSDWIGE